MPHRVAVPVLVAVALAGCKANLQTTPCTDTVAAGDAVTCDLAGFDDRAYDLVVPASYSGEPIPLLIAFHGGGGNKEGALRTTCPSGDLQHNHCLHKQADDRGYAVVLPNGSGDDRLSDVRTWNAGGGVDNWRCASGDACENNVDDVAYVGALLDDIATRLAVDPSRVFTTGISNGGAISHRLACELSDRIAAIAPIGGAMQFTTAATCAPGRPVPVLHAHGTDDTCWQYEGGVPTCGGSITGQEDKEHVPVSRTMDEWAAINGCTGIADEVLLDDADPDDGTTTTRIERTGCQAPVQLLRIDGGGHTWPRGQQYLRESLVGRVPQDWGNDVLFDFFDANPMP